jgi:hypothetical protein
MPRTVTIPKPLIPLLLTAVAVYVNIVTFGFIYGDGNHALQLPLVNWLKDPALYPDDPIRKGFEWFPTLFWSAIAFFSPWVGVQKLVFISFLITKVLFFSALVLLIRDFLPEYRFTACIVLSIGLSDFLNDSSPFGYSDVLTTIQTHTSLAVALILWVGLLLTKGYWKAAALVLAGTAYINALFVIYTSFAVAAFAFLDWKQNKRSIITAAVLMVVIALPWFVSQAKLSSGFPESYVETILMHYPYHFTLRFHPAGTLLWGFLVIAVAVCAPIVGTRFGIVRDRRLELLAASYAAPFLLGVMVGEFYPFPSIVRLQFLRADSFLMLYSIVLVQVYGAKVLIARQQKFAMLFATCAILWPLVLPVNNWLPPVIFVLLSVLHVVHPGIIFLATSALALARLLGVMSIPGKLAALAAVASAAFLVWQKRRWLQWRFRNESLPEIAGKRRLDKNNPPLLVCAVVLVIAMIGKIPAPLQLWNPILVTEKSKAWREAQDWAKLNTSPDVKFLVPPHPFGFRMFSERGIWVDWIDGNLVHTYPGYADEWRQRMAAIGVTLKIGEYIPVRQVTQYKEQAWDKLAALAKAQRLSYVIQYSDVKYEIQPVFKNNLYAIYPVFAQGSER